MNNESKNNNVVETNSIKVDPIKKCNTLGPISSTSPIHTIDIDKKRCSKTLPVKVLPSGSLNQNEVNDLFGNLEDIFIFSSNFLEQLTNCNSDPDLISRCFIQQSFDVYTHYCATQYPKYVSFFCIINLLL